MAAPLLRTKLTIPELPHDLIERTGLLDRLNAGLVGKFTMLCAPAGFGKSSLAAALLRQRTDLNCAWISLDESDNDLRSFLTYLVAAFRQTDDQLGHVTQSILQSPRPPSIPALMTPLINDIDELDTPVLLVLDDYHVIDLQEIHDVLTFLLAHQPSNFHLMILSRSDPPLPLGRLRAQGQILELRSAELRFTQEESGAFYSSVMHMNLEDDEVSALTERTEGWVAGLQLAGLAIQKQNDPAAYIERFSGSHAYLVDYLGEEVLSQQSPEIREFLLKTAILDRFNSDLGNALTGITHSQSIIAALQQANLFLIPLDHDQQWFRYHHLFSDFLKFRLKRTYPEHEADLHQLASDWFYDNGYIDDAIHHALAGERYDNAADFIERAALEMVGQARFGSLKQWLDALPPGLYTERPYLDVLLAWTSVLAGRPRNAIDQLALAEEAMQHVPAKSPVWSEIVCQIELLHGYVARSSGDLVTAIAQTRKALESLPEDNTFLQCTVYLNLGGNYWLSGDLAAAEDPLVRASAFVDQAGTEYPALAAAGFLANVYLQTGRLQKAKKHCAQMIKSEYSRHSYPLPAIAYIYVEQGELLYEQNDLAAAEEILETAIHLGENVDRVVNIVRASALIALIKHASGDAKAVEHYFEQANTLFEASGSRYSLMHQIEFDYYCVRLWLMQGNLALASQWAHDYEEKHHPDTTWNILNELSFARVLLANRQPRKAITVLKQCQDSAQSLAIAGWVIQSLVLKALCYQALRDDDQALQSIAHALSLAEPEGYVRSFVDEGHAMSNLLTTLLARYEEFASSPYHLSVDYVSYLITTIRGEHNQSGGLIEPLTDREIDILRLLAGGLTNPEIADELVISVGTVKQYNHAIYRKLDVHTRSDAVKRAQNLNLL